MRKYILPLLFLLATVYLSLTSFISGESNKYFPLTDSTKSNVCVDTFYCNAYNELHSMLNGTKPISFKRAVFITENAYWKGHLDYPSYLNEIDRITGKLKELIAKKHLEKFKTAGNWAAFEYMTDSIPENKNKPYSYDFDDFMGEKDWTKMFITKLMYTHSGNCHSLPYFYKILAEEMGVQACLAMGPNHVYVKHIDEKGNWANLELTNGHFSSDGWIISQMGITAEQIQSGIYMKPLSEKESIALCVSDLQEGYKIKHGSDDFALQCCNLGLHYFPNCINLLMEKNNYLLDIIHKILNENGHQKNAETDKLNEQCVSVNHLIDSLGYKDMPKDLYEAWIKSVQEEQAKHNSKPSQ